MIRMTQARGYSRTRSWSRCEDERLFPSESDPSVYRPSGMSSRLQALHSRQPLYPHPRSRQRGKRSMNVAPVTTMHLFLGWHPSLLTQSHTSQSRYVSYSHRLILYTSLSQLRFTLLNCGSWRVLDGEFNYNDFYNNIVLFFERTKTPEEKKFVQNLLLWWNQWRILYYCFEYWLITLT